MKKRFNKRFLTYTLCYVGAIVVIIGFFLIWCAITGTNILEWLTSKWAMFIYFGVGVLTFAYLILTLNELANKNMK